MNTKLYDIETDLKNPYLDELKLTDITREVRGLPRALRDSVITQKSTASASFHVFYF